MVGSGYLLLRAAHGVHVPVCGGRTARRQDRWGLEFAGLVQPPPTPPTPHGSILFHRLKGVPGVFQPHRCHDARSSAKCSATSFAVLKRHCPGPSEVVCSGGRLRSRGGVPARRCVLGRHGGCRIPPTCHGDCRTWGVVGAGRSRSRCPVFVPGGLRLSAGMAFAGGAEESWSGAADHDGQGIRVLGDCPLHREGVPVAVGAGGVDYEDLVHGGPLFVVWWGAGVKEADAGELLGDGAGQLVGEAGGTHLLHDGVDALARAEGVEIVVAGDPDEYARFVVGAASDGALGAVVVHWRASWRGGLWATRTRVRHLLPSGQTPRRHPP